MIKLRTCLPFSFAYVSENNLLNNLYKNKHYSYYKVSQESS